MEELCGLSLLNRHRRGVSLTPVGIELLNHAKRVFNELERLGNTLSEFGSGARGQVKVVANTSAIVQFLPHDFASFIAEHPTVKLDLEECTSDETQKILLSGLADFGILVSKHQVEGLEFVPYRSDELVVILPVGHPLSAQEVVSFAEVLAYDHLGLPRGTALCDMLEEQAKLLNQRMRLRIQARSYEGLVNMVAAGIGISLLPEGSVTAFVKARQVVARPLQEPWAKRDLILATKTGQPLTAVAALLFEHLVIQGKH